MFIDPLYLVLMVVTLLISGGAQLYLRSAFGRWSREANSNGLSGAQVGEAIIQRTSLANQPFKPLLGGQEVAAKRANNAAGLTFEMVGGQLSDHYDPSSHTVRMSEEVARGRSVMAMAVVAHELGHAEQHEQNSLLIQMRNLLLPALQFSPMLSYGMIFGGFLLNITGLIWLGIGLFSLMVIFSVLTLPVEIDASKRGLRLLREAGLLQTETDASGSRQMLTAAAMTYIAAAVTSVLTLLYYISLATRR